MTPRSEPHRHTVRPLQHLTLVSSVALRRPHLTGTVSSGPFTQPLVPVRSAGEQEVPGSHQPPPPATASTKWRSGWGVAVLPFWIYPGGCPTLRAVRLLTGRWGSQEKKGRGHSSLEKGAGDKALTCSTPTVRWPLVAGVMLYPNIGHGEQCSCAVQLL